MNEDARTQACSTEGSSNEEIENRGGTGEPKEFTNTDKGFSQSARQRGRPHMHQEAWSRTNVILLDRQIHWLDQLCADIRLNTKVALSRAEIIRALIDALAFSDLALRQCKSEDEIANLLKTYLGRKDKSK